jgi:predicted secreted protein
VSNALKQAQELLEQVQLNSEMADVGHNAMREAFEQRESVIWKLITQHYGTGL